MGIIQQIEGIRNSLGAAGRRGEVLLVPEVVLGLGSVERAAFVARLDFWLERCGHWRDGRRWVYNTLEGWCEDLPWLSLGTLRRVIGALRAMGVVRVARYNRVPTDRTLWYTLDYEVLGEILRGVVAGRAQMEVRNLRRSYQVDTPERDEGGRGHSRVLEDRGAQAAPGDIPDCTSQNGASAK